MKIIFVRLLALLVLSLTFINPAMAASETYVLDPFHTYVLWHINHFGFSNPSGKWLADGTLVLDEAHPENSKLNATIKVGDMITGIPKLDEHLKSKEFFNIAQFPMAKFVSDKVTVSGNTAKVHGMLTVHGVTKPVTLDVKLNKIGVSPITNKKTAGFTATTTLKRSDFGMNTYLPGLGDEVQINIEAEAYQKP
ncbi:MAG: YceI family protein [Gammaproteobacteria bacterium]